MSTRRLVDVALVVLAALLLGAGATYWVAAAPAPAVPPVVGSSAPEAEPAEEALDLGQLEHRVANELTISSRSVLSDIARLEAGESRLYQIELDADTSYAVEAVCAGEGVVSVDLPSESVVVPCESDPMSRAYGFAGLYVYHLNVVNHGHGPVVVGIGVRPE